MGSSVLSVLGVVGMRVGIGRVESVLWVVRSVMNLLVLNAVLVSTSSTTFASAKAKTSTTHLQRPASPAPNSTPTAPNAAHPKPAKNAPLASA